MFKARYRIKPTSSQWFVVQKRWGLFWFDIGNWHDTPEDARAYINRLVALCTYYDANGNPLV